MKKTMCAALAATMGAFAACAAEMPASGRIELPGTYAGHLQEVCRDGDCLYWMQTRVLIKTDLTGKVLAQKDVEGHHAGAEVRDGKLYVAVCAMQSTTGGKTLPGSRVQINVYDTATLDLLEEHVTDINDRSGSFCFLEDGTCLVGCLRHPELKPDQVRFHHLDRSFKLIRSHVLSGVTVKLGIEVIKRRGDFVYLFMYRGKGLCVKLDRSFREVARFDECPGNLGIFWDGKDVWCGVSKAGPEPKSYRSELVRRPDFDPPGSTHIVNPTEHVIHRGWGLLWPENSMAALERCWNAGFIPEADARISKDGVAYIFHDATYMGRKVSDMTWDELRAIDIGEKKGRGWKGTHAPTLEEVFAAMAGRPERRIAMDHKTLPNARLHELAKKYGVERQIYYCTGGYKGLLDWLRYVPDAHSVLWLNGGSWKKLDFSDEAEILKREEFMRKNFEAIADAGFKGLDLVELIVYAHPSDPTMFCPRAPFIKDAFARIRAAGKKPVLLIWSEGDKLQTYRNLAALGVDLFGTDYPETLEAYLKSR